MHGFEPTGQRVLWARGVLRRSNSSTDHTGGSEWASFFMQKHFTEVTTGGRLRTVGRYTVFDERGLRT